MAVVEPTPPGTEGGSLLRRGERFSSPFVWTFATGFGLVTFYAVANLALTVWAVNGTEGGSLAKAAFTVRMVQISLAMMIAFFSIFLGVIAAWMGLEAKYQMTGTAGGVGLAIADASPGILLILSGTVIICICLLKQVEAHDGGLTDVTTSEYTVRPGPSSKAPPPPPR